MNRAEAETREADARAAWRVAAARATAIRAVPHAAAEARVAAEVEDKAFHAYIRALRAAEAVVDEEADHD